MRADTVKFYDSIKTLDRDSLLSFCVDLYERKRSAEIECAEQEKIATEAAILYQQEKKAHIETAAELAECQKLIQKLSEQNDLKTRAIFGRNTEKMLDMLKQASDPAEEFEDESQTEDNGKSPKKPAKITSLEKYKEQRAQAGKDGSDKNPESEKRTIGKTRRRRLKESLEKLPFRTDFDLDVEKLNELFGKGSWRIAHWKVHYKIEKIECPIYVRRTYTPVISSGLEHVMTTIPYRNPLLDRSYLSESFAADFLYRKFYLSLPDYRQSFDYQMQGLDVSRQDLIVWTNKLVLRIMPVIRDYLLDLFLKCVYSQCDESFLLVNRDGRSAGTKSIMWVHSTSELLGIPPIVLFFYEATRGTEHLRFLLAEFHGYITCDAYISYQVIEKESNGRIITTGCLMHYPRNIVIPGDRCETA